MSHPPVPNLPVLIEGPESIRRANALFDLHAIKTLAAEVHELDQYATTAASEVISSHMSVEVPQDYKDIRDLFTHFHPDADDKTPKLSHADIVDTFIGPDADTQIGVSDRNIAVDATAALHPDKLPTQGVHITADSGDTLKALTNAQALGRRRTVQAMYAKTVATSATHTDESTPMKEVSEIELARYKAQVALQAAKGKFASKDDVDQWKQQQIDRIPAIVRAAGLGQVIYVLGQLLGADAEGRVSVSGYYAQEIISGIDRTYVRIQELRDESRPSGLETDFDRRMFDRRFSLVVSELESVLRERRGTYITCRDASPITKALIETCEKPIDASRIALHGLYSMLKENNNKNIITN